ncbi:T9SS type A sorting domain-containing protein [Dysgonomonas sp.]
MRFRLVLAVLFFLPLVVKGQTPTPATPVGVKFYSKGSMYVGYGTTNSNGADPLSTTLYIQGSAEFADNSSIEQKGRTALTEDFINSKSPSIPSNLFVTNPTVKNEGVVAFIGSNNKQAIKGSGVFGQKAENWIKFPTIRVEKVSSNPYTATSLDPREYNYLAVDSSAAIMVDYLVVPGYNRFAVEGGYAVGAPSKLNMGQALFKNEPEAGYPGAYSQVKLDMYRYARDEDEGDDGLFDSNHEAEEDTKNKTLRNGEGWNYLTGFTPPFTEMGADYFFYHTLTKPSQSSFNSWAGNIVDPYTKLEAGYGYFMSMEVTDFDHDHISKRWKDGGMGTNSNENRARGGFTFNRAVMEDYLGSGNAATADSRPDTGNQSGFSRFAYLPNGNPDQTKPIGAGSHSDPNPNPNHPIGNIDKHLLIEKEKFVISNVTVALQKGFNFLGNPFMAPISLNYLLGLDYTDPNTGTNYPAVTSMDNGVSLKNDLFGAGIKASAVYQESTENMLRAKYWLINNASVKYDSSDGLMHFKATYDYISREAGGTGAVFKTQVNTDDDDHNPNVVTSILPDKYLIAPMQMFGLQANNDFSITLSPALRTFGMTRFQKSASESVDLLKDYLIVEVVSPIEKTSDRTAVVMRENARLDYSGDPYDTRKGISKAMETYVERDLEGLKRVYPAPSTSIVYTKSKDGESLLGNGVPLRTKEVPLYVTPPASQQTMTLNFYNLENMVSVPDVWLIDRYENKTVKLTDGYSYNFTSGPSDLNDKENRFILRFWGDDEEVIQGQTEDISVYYNTSVLHISGLNQDDINSDIQIYDLQGRLIARTKVNNAPSMEYLKPLSLGTYIVKITGKRNFTSKFVNLQN